MSENEQSEYSVMCTLCCVLQKLCTVQSVNCRDIEGRQSTPLHFAAGYNRVSVVEYLLQHGADVHAKDKGQVLAIAVAFLCLYLTFLGKSENVCMRWWFFYFQRSLFSNIGLNIFLNFS